MLLTNRFLLLLFLFLAFWMKTIVDQVQAQASQYIVYGSLNPNHSVSDPAMPITTSVGSSVTTDDTSSWMSSSGRFAFGFYRENDVFSVGIRLFASPIETVVVWTARPDLKRFSKDAFLNFTKNGLFVTPEKGAKAFCLYNFNSTATSAVMLDDGNFIVFSSNISNNSYSRGCQGIYRCQSDNSNSDIGIWRSFDFPSDTILGNQILHCGHNLTSSSGNTDHSIGTHILNLPCSGAGLISYELNSADKNWDTGSFGGEDGSLNLDENGRLFLTSSSGNEKDLSGYKPKITPDNMIYRATLDSDNIFRLYALNLDTNSTTVVNEIPYYKDKCQTKEFCGVNSYCFIANGDAQCNCMPGFDYINPDSHIAGCRRNKTLPSCSAAFAAALVVPLMEPVDNIVGMDDLAYAVLSTPSQEECSNACLSDCNCDAASFIDQNCLKLKLPLTSGRKD